MHCFNIKMIYCGKIGQISIFLVNSLLLYRCMNVNMISGAFERKKKILLPYLKSKHPHSNHPVRFQCFTHIRIQSLNVPQIRHELKNDATHNKCMHLTFRFFSLQTVVMVSILCGMWHFFLYLKIFLVLILGTTYIVFLKSNINSY